MITVNGKQYAANDSEFTDTLFTSGGTASGYYKQYKHRIIFMDMQKNPIAALVRNKNGNFLVNCGTCEGKYFYQFALSDHLEPLFGVPDGYIAGIEYVNSLAKQLLN